MGVVGLLGTGCDRGAPTGRDAASQGARPLELLVTSDSDTLDPRYAVDIVSMRVTRLLHAGLVRLDADTLEPQPYAAASWGWTTPLTLRVALRPGLRFHSGAELTAHDVVATLRAFASPAVASRHARVVDAIASVEEDGALAVVITLKRPHATLLTDLELPILRADEAFSPPSPSGALDGLGPYALDLAASTHGDLHLTPARGGALPTPAHALVIRTVHDENARALRLHAGRADVAVNAFSPTLLPALDAAHGLTITSRAGANLTYLVLRNDRAPFASLDARRALSLALNRDEIARTLLAGHAEAATTLLPKGHWAHAASASVAPPWTYDRDAAIAALARAGYGAGGRPLRITWLTSTDRLRMSIARTFAQELRAVGIEVEVVPLELGTMIARLNAGDFDVASLQLPELTEPNVLRVFLHSESIPPNGANRGRVRDSEIDALLDEGATATDRQIRITAYDRLETRVRDTLPIIPLWHEDQIGVTSARARGFVPSAEGRWLGLATLP